MRPKLLTILCLIPVFFEIWGKSLEQEGRPIESVIVTMHETSNPIKEFRVTSKKPLKIYNTGCSIVLSGFSVDVDCHIDNKNLQFLKISLVSTQAFALINSANKQYEVRLKEIRYE